MTTNVTTREYRLYEALLAAHKFLGGLIENCPAESNGIAQFMDEHMWPVLYGDDDFIRAIFRERQSMAEIEREEDRVIAELRGDDWTPFDDDPEPAA